MSEKKADKKATPASKKKHEDEIKKLEKEKEELNEKLKEMEMKYLRALADLENYKKFSTKEYARLLESTKKEIFLSLLNVVDNFERAIKHASNKEDPFYKGVEMIYKSLVKLLEDYGVKSFESVGKAFDHNFHDAVEFIIDNDKPEHTIVEEQMKGYTYKDEVLRHARVVVTKKSEETEETKEEVN